MEVVRFIAGSCLELTCPQNNLRVVLYYFTSYSLLINIRIHIGRITLEDTLGPNIILWVCNLL
jgi:hypothetical protein